MPYQQLSGGEQLKFHLADAFSQIVDVLLLTNHLDLHSRENVNERLRYTDHRLTFTGKVTDL
ncbi:hypothetical protein SAMN05421839_14913 [Halolactibacillus halophilus]|uniref:Uncharacterized protein n=1 Tax=Halolactibacillus halophilus TaxID=306540 RepID=A0A1I5SQH1_9BACI|nr:hypothetical protein [Halolactibacillus halophilus]GEM02636.1 hypothetical protein HHA03_21680 [Halolactibacillus halophilus]SFP72871.1 hypothetical protein SAMN05421839_14913 [Halolactibacillus halophilus]